MPKVFSDLSLHGTAPARVQPKVGSWGPEGVPGTRHKQWVRIGAVVGYVLALALLIGLATWLYFQMFKQA